MRIYIGPYYCWFRPAKWYRDWILWARGFGYNVDHEKIDVEAMDALTQRIQNSWIYDKLMDLERWVDNKVQRKIRIKVHNYDVWSADHTLGLIILPTLKLLKEKKQGYAIVDDNDVPEELRSTSAPPLTQEQIDTACPDNNGEPRWNWVLGEMIWAFEQLVNEDSDDQFFTHHDEPESPGSVFNKCDIDREGYEKWQARKQNGLLLFGKYYEALWD